MLEFNKGDPLMMKQADRHHGWLKTKLDEQGVKYIDYGHHHSCRPGCSMLICWPDSLEQIKMIKAEISAARKIN